MALLERERFLQQLGSFVKEAILGHGTVVFLGGEAGVGKTALLRAFASFLPKTLRLATGACDPLSTPRPLGPLVDVTAALGLETISEKTPRPLIFQNVLDSFKLKPTVVVFEDVHWADEATLDLLRFVGRRISASQTLLVATYRDDEIGGRHPLRLVLGDLATLPLKRMSLPRLSLAAVRHLAQDKALDADELYRQTGGNPFFVTEILAGDAPGLPATVLDAVLARVARLSPSGCAVLEAAAVIGSRVEPWLLGEVVGAEITALDECLSEGALRLWGHEVAFRHELARQAMLEATPPHRQQALHRLVLNALVASPAKVRDPARLAHHAEAAGDREAVLCYAPEAARRAAGLSSHREAAAQYARALRFAGGLLDVERAELLDAYADECGHTDDQTEAVRAREAAIALWRELGDGLREGRSLVKLSNELIRAGRDPEVENVSFSAQRALEPLRDTSELARAYLNHGYLQMISRNNAEAVSWCERAISLAGPSADADFRIRAYNVLGTSQLMAGDDAPAVPNLLKSAQLAREVGLEGGVATAYSMLGTGSGELYKFARAEQYLNESISIATKLDLDFARFYAASWLALVHCYQGRWDEATETARSVINRLNVAAISQTMALVALGRVRARRGDPEVRSVLDEALGLAVKTATLQRLGPVRAARAEAAWLGGDADRTRTEARAAFDLALQKRHPWFVGELAYWCWKADDLSEIPVAAAEPFALQMAGEWREAAAVWMELGCPYEAARALAEGDDEAALKEALATFTRLGAAPAAQRLGQRLRELGVKGVPRGPRPATQANPAKLTRRQLEVLLLLAEGRSNADIAARLFCSPKTVDHHVSAVLGKLEVGNRMEAVREAVRLGILGQPRESKVSN